MIPELRGRLSAGQAVLDGDLRDLAIVSGPGGPVLYALSGPHGGLSAFRLNADGSATALSDPVFFADGTTGVGSGELVIGGQEGDLRLLSGAGAFGQMRAYDLSASGGLDPAQQIAFPGMSGRVSELATVTLQGGRMAYYVLEDGSGQLRGYIGNNTLSPISGSGSLPAATATALMQGVSAGSNQFLLVAGADGGPGTITSYQIDPNSGVLHIRDSSGAIDGLGLSDPTVLETVEAHGTTYVIVGAAGSQSLSVLRLDPDGNLSGTDHQLDTQMTRFGEVQALAVLETEGHVFVVAGGGDDGLSLFSLLPGGQLLHLHSLAHDTGLGLEDVTALEMTRIGDSLQIFASSEAASGISHFTVPLGDLGEVLQDTDADGHTIAGTAGHDVLIASPTGGRDRLEGGEGNDTLVSGQSGTDLTGGAGADLFVLNPSSTLHRIFDFEPGVDRLDLSGFLNLRNPGQLHFETRETGARITFQDTEIRLDAGRELTQADLWPQGQFDWPDRFPVGLQAPSRPASVTFGNNDDRITGTAEDEIFTGGGGADTFVITLGGGADTITDFDPNEDSLDFSALTAAQQAQITAQQVGNDRLVILGDFSTLTLVGVTENNAPTGVLSLQGWLGVGQELWMNVGVLHDVDGLGVLSYQWLRDGQAITGAIGATYRLTAQDENAQISATVRYVDHLATHETVSSSTSAEVLMPVHGTAAANTMSGTGARDFIQSGAGDDTVNGAAGDDILMGEAGDDLLTGSDGQDGLLGGAGLDTLYGGAGQDTLLGGGDADLLGGGDGNDLLEGGAGNDVIYTSRGSDTAHGGDGADMLGGFYGDDSLWGGGGDDELWGSHGNDTLWGEGGADTLGGFLGNDSLNGEAGADELWGAAGNDTLDGGADDDSVGGGQGDDHVSGGAGQDGVYGGSGNDTLDGGTGEDTLFGADGNDHLIGGAGDDLMYGGGGADVFVFGADHGVDRIGDFTPGVDRIHVTIPGRGGPSFSTTLQPC